MPYSSQITSVQNDQSDRLQFWGERRVQGGNGDVHGHSVELGQLRQQIHIPGDEEVLRDDANRIAEIQQHLQAAAGELELPLERLITIGHAAHPEHLRFPFR